MRTTIRYTLPDSDEFVELLITNYNNVIARGFKTMSELKEHYRQSSPHINLFTLQNAIITAIQKLRKYFPVLYDHSINWNIVISNQMVECGLPFTMWNKFIVIPHNYIDRQDLVKVLIHEYIHLLQDKYPEIFNDYYTRRLGYIACPKPHYEFLRDNPDLVGEPWYAFQNKLLVLKDIQRRTVRHPRIIFRGNPKIFKLFFGNQIPEHPKEFFAECIARLCTNDPVLTIAENHIVVSFGRN